MHEVLDARLAIAPGDTGEAPAKYGHTWRGDMALV